MHAPLIEAIGLSHKFDYPLYNNVNLSINKGESVAVLGRSGSGKSTLLHTLSSFIKPNSGTVKLFGKDIYAMSEKNTEKLRREEIGIIFQSHYLFKGMTGLENIGISTLLADTEIDYAILDELEIADIVDQKIGDLSGGQQQRVSIARVLNKKPNIIFADEPTGNLDNQTAKIVTDVLTAYIKRNNGALLMVTHDKNVADSCDAKYNLKDKRLSKI